MKRKRLVSHGDILEFGAAVPGLTGPQWEVVHFEDDGIEQYACIMARVIFGLAGARVPMRKLEQMSRDRAVTIKPPSPEEMFCPEHRYTVNELTGEKYSDLWGLN